jgi:hypothetical protein
MLSNSYSARFCIFESPWIKDITNIKPSGPSLYHC